MPQKIRRKIPCNSVLHLAAKAAEKFAPATAAEIRKLVSLFPPYISENRGPFHHLPGNSHAPEIHCAVALASLAREIVTCCAANPSRENSGHLHTARLLEPVMPYLPSHVQPARGPLIQGPSKSDGKIRALDLKNLL